MVQVDGNDLLSMPFKPSAKYVSICDLATLLQTSQLFKLKLSADEKGFQGSSVMALFSSV